MPGGFLRRSAASYWVRFVGLCLARSFPRCRCVSMQIYSIEAATADLSSLAHLASKGEEVLLTEDNKLVAKLVAVDEADAWRRDVRALRGFTKGIPSFVRE